MTTYRKILLSLLLAGVSLSASSEEKDFPSDSFPSDFKEVQDRTMNLDLEINRTTKITLENIPTTGYLEVYSILGLKVTSVNLKTILGSYPLELPKGIYIIKAGKVAQKIIVR
ncbi:T9SS type A sorting domain-containing protein [Dysgonomonas sp. Marseille-P4677]|uniref:T9SS type A sorting domain-containing protein n=1 Tax=Dysgonomonas sp. Marseille-P4677 TaxID=2364790 RepID=UPI001911A886|nr:T9SS type A sorting domain-containing protein [Dysgonomonas sp. Marseille-P4677]MBK5722473.1 T9SS type A sorting domain-containing protein [Dysgonomonas sp. Marseille-P4677]